MSSETHVGISKYQYWQRNQKELYVCKADGRCMVLRRGGDAIHSDCFSRPLRKGDVVRVACAVRGATRLLTFGLGGVDNARPSYVLDASTPYYLYLRQGKGNAIRLFSFSQDVKGVSLNPMGGNCAEAESGNDGDAEGLQAVPLCWQLQVNTGGVVDGPTFRALYAAPSVSAYGRAPIEFEHFSFSVRVVTCSDGTRVGVATQSVGTGLALYLGADGRACLRQATRTNFRACFSRRLRDGDLVSCKMDGNALTFGLNGVYTTEPAFQLSQLDSFAVADLRVYLTQSDRCTMTIVSYSGVDDDDGDVNRAEAESGDEGDAEGLQAAMNPMVVPLRWQLQTNSSGVVEGPTFRALYAIPPVSAYGRAPIELKRFSFSVRVVTCSDGTRVGVTTQLNGMGLAMSVVADGRACLRQGGRTNFRACLSRRLRDGDVVSCKMDGNALTFGLNGVYSTEPSFQLNQLENLDVADLRVLLMQSDRCTMTIVSYSGESDELDDDDGHNANRAAAESGDDEDVEGLQAPLNPLAVPLCWQLQANYNGVIDGPTFRASYAAAVSAYGRAPIEMKRFSFSVRVVTCSDTTRVGVTTQPRATGLALYLGADGRACVRQATRTNFRACFSRRLRDGDVVSCKMDGNALTFGLNGVYTTEPSFQLSQLDSFAVADLRVYLMQSDRCTMTIVSYSGESDELVDNDGDDDNRAKAESGDDGHADNRAEAENGHGSRHVKRYRARAIVQVRGVAPLFFSFV